jgi:hypothetical protein
MGCLLQANLQRMAGAFGPTSGAATKEDLAFAVVDFFNVVLGSTVKSRECWSQVSRRRLCTSGVTPALQRRSCTCRFVCVHAAQPRPPSPINHHPLPPPLPWQALVPCVEAVFNYKFAASAGSVADRFHKPQLFVALQVHGWGY